MKKFYLSTLTLMAILPYSFGQATFSNIQFLTNSTQNTEVLSQASSTQVLASNTVLALSTINDVTGAKLVTENGDNKDFLLSGISTTGALGGATVTLNPSGSFSRVRADHSYIGAVTANNPGTVVSNTFTLKFNANLTVTAASFNFSSLNTSGVAWEYSVIQFLDVSGNPFSTLTNPGFTIGAPAQYSTANALSTVGFTGQAGMGNFIAAKSNTVTGVGGTTASGTSGTNDNLGTLNYAQVGLMAGTVIGGIRWSTYLEDVRGTTNGNTSFTSSLLDFTITGSVSNVVLAADKLSFKGAKLNWLNLLKWQTEGETNLKGFEVQSSTNGLNFNTIAFVNAAAQNGGKQTYTFEDNSMASAKSLFYRLVEVSNDNAKKNSEIIFINGLGNNTTIKTYPNPVVNTLYLNINVAETKQVAMAIYNSHGKVCLQKNITLASGYNSVPVNVATLPSGTYFIKYANNINEQCQTATFVK